MAVGGRWRLAVSGWWWPAVGGGQMVVVGGWWSALGGTWALVVGFPWGLSLKAVLNKKKKRKIGVLKDSGIYKIAQNTPDVPYEQAPAVPLTHCLTDTCICRGSRAVCKGTALEAVTTSGRARHKGSTCVRRRTVWGCSACVCADSAGVAREGQCMCL